MLVHLMSGLAQVRAGRIDRARGHLEMQERLFNSGVEAENWWHRALEGEIALATGDLEKAASTFSAGQPSKKMWFSTFYSNLSILANNLMSRDGLARVAKARGISPRDSNLSSTAVLWARPEVGVGIRAAVCAGDRAIARSFRRQPGRTEGVPTFSGVLEKRRFRLARARRSAASRRAALISRTGDAMTLFSRSPFG